ncbi:phosphatase PAP2 family protein [Streptomyces harbinensis]
MRSSTQVLKRAAGAWKREPTEPAPRPPLIRELLLLTVLYAGYKLGRRAANGQFGEAYRNAELIWDFERAVRMPSEAWVQEVMMHFEPVIRAINIYYATVHFPATVAFIAWMYFRRPGFYVWIRWVLVWLTGAGLVLHLLVPLAPPRLYKVTGLVDTSAVFGPSVYASKPDPDSLANQFAAMPSLHVGWSIVIAVGLIVATRGRWRWLWLAHPVITVTAVVATGHHYWMDGLVAAFFLGVILLVLRPPRAAAARAIRTPLTLWRPAPSPTPGAAPASGAAPGVTPVRSPRSASGGSGPPGRLRPPRRKHRRRVRGVSP